MTDLTKSYLFSPESKTRYHGENQDRLDKLLTALPVDGRLSYDSENMKSLKPMVNKIIEWEDTHSLVIEFISLCKINTETKAGIDM